MSRYTNWAGRPVPGRNIILACGHNEAFATLALDEDTAWCPVCEAQVEVTVTCGSRVEHGPHDAEFYCEPDGRQLELRCDPIIHCPGYSEGGQETP